jgi:hypothetical protein
MSALRLEAFIDAVRALRALEEAEQEDGPTPERSQAIKDAKYLVKSYEAHLTAREHWLADRELNKSRVQQTRLALLDALLCDEETEA